MSVLKLVLWGFLAVLGSVALVFVVGLVNPQERVNGLSLAGRGGGLLVQTRTNHCVRLQSVVAAWCLSRAGLAEHAFAGVDECGEDESGGDFRSADQDARWRFHLIPFIGFERRRGQGGRRKGQWAATFTESGLDARECGRKGCRFSVQFGKSQEAQRGVEDVGVARKELVADIREDVVSDALKVAVRIEGGARRRRQRRERFVAATEVGAIEFRQIIDVGARIGEGAGVDQAALKPNNLSQCSLPARILADAPAFVVEEADLQNVEVEGGVQIVAAGRSPARFSIQVATPPLRSRWSLMVTVGGLRRFSCATWYSA